MDAVNSCRRVADDALELISSVQPAEWDAATPCEAWNARALVNHMIGTCVSFVAGLRKGSAEATPEPLDLGAGDPATVYERANNSMGSGTPMGFTDAQLPEAYRRATAALAAEWAQPGALERTVYLSFTSMPGAMGIKISTADALIHSWDLAKALGKPFSMDEEVATTTLELMQQFNNPDSRGPGKPFGHAIPVPESAPVQDRLVGLSGRQP